MTLAHVGNLGGAMKFPRPPAAQGYVQEDSHAAATG
jgi:hypothetical protein